MMSYQSMAQPPPPPASNYPPMAAAPDPRVAAYPPAYDPYASRPPEASQMIQPQQQYHPMAMPPGAYAAQFMHQQPPHQGVPSWAYSPAGPVR